MTKKWRSRERQQKDCEEKHQEFCKHADKGLGWVSVQEGDWDGEPPLESLEKSLQLNKDMPAETQSMLSEVKHLCKKSAKRSSDD